MFVRTLVTAVVLLGSSLAARADAVFDFESTAAGASLPLTLTNNGLSATFAGNGGVCAAIGLQGPLFSTLTGNILIQNFCVTSGVGPLSVTFSENVSTLTFNFVTQDGPDSISVAMFENGVPVGTQVFTSAVPKGFLCGEGTAAVKGTFNSIVITSATPMALDNVDAATVAPSAAASSSPSAPSSSPSAAPSSSPSAAPSAAPSSGSSVSGK